MNKDTLRKLREPHRRFDGSVVWHLAPTGVSIDGQEPIGTLGEPATVRRIWAEHEESIRRWSAFYRVPAELIVATIATESGGRADAVRHEPRYESDESTPYRVSVGVMQTLISTAQATLGQPGITRKWLLNPDNSIRAGTAYLAEQEPQTLSDPPVVACAYNAGGVYEQKGADNRWKMRQFPIGSGKHADRFVMWFNDCFRMFQKDGGAPEMSFYHALNVTAVPELEPQPEESPVQRILAAIRGLFAGG